MNKATKNKLDLFDFLSKNESIYVQIQPDFLLKIRELIKSNFKTLKSFNNKYLRIEYPNLKHDFRLAQYHHFIRWLKIIKCFKINKEILYENIIGFRVSGSHGKTSVKLLRNLEINEKFVEGYSLYIAEGDTGLSGKKIPRKLRFTNSNLEVIRFFINWIREFFPNNDFYLNTILPIEINVEKDFYQKLCKELNIDISAIRIKKEHYNKKIKYKLCCDNAILIDIILEIDNIVKKLCKNNKILSKSYIRGMMTGEGTVYFNRSRYVRIEMKNKKEINYIHSLLKKLKYKCKISYRKERVGMCSIYIGAKQIDKFYKEIGFGSQNDRQNILKLAANKILKVNQYI
jgi:hypothetical protein